MRPNPSAEARKFMVSRFKSGRHVFDATAGAGAFGLALARHRRCHVVLNDLNPAAGAGGPPTSPSLGDGPLPAWRLTLAHPGSPDHLTPVHPTVSPHLTPPPHPVSPRPPPSDPRELSAPFRGG